MPVKGICSARTCCNMLQHCLPMRRITLSKSWVGCLVFGLFLVFCFGFFSKFHSWHACFGTPKEWVVQINEFITSHVLKQSPALRRHLAQGSGEISGQQILCAGRGLLCFTASMVARPSYPSSAEENPFHIKYNYRRKLAANFWESVTLSFKGAGFLFNFKYISPIWE